MVSLGALGKMTAHKAVALAFHGARPEGLEVAHLDGCKWSNSPLNLCYATREVNLSHKAWHGTLKRGTNHPQARLDAAAVRAIRSAAGSISQRELAERYAVSQGHISDIINRKRWSHTP
jgi:hypothetical protein